MRQRAISAARAIGPRRSPADGGPSRRHAVHALTCGQRCPSRADPARPRARELTLRCLTLRRPAANRPIASRASFSTALSRRAAIPAFAAAFAAAAALPPRSASAEPSAPADGTAGVSPVVWVTGRSDPLRKTSKAKPDGTRKDPKYLSCLNDCVPRCQSGSGDVQKDRSDCFDECQDECCFTYQQCTGARVRLG